MSESIAESIQSQVSKAVSGLTKRVEESTRKQNLQDQKVKVLTDRTAEAERRMALTEESFEKKLTLAMDLFNNRAGQLQEQLASQNNNINQLINGWMTALQQGHAQPQQLSYSQPVSQATPTQVSATGQNNGNQQAMEISSEEEQQDLQQPGITTPPGGMLTRNPYTNQTPAGVSEAQTRIATQSGQSQQETAIVPRTGNDTEVRTADTQLIPTQIGNPQELRKTRT
jgi:hypothetical protein